MYVSIALVETPAEREFREQIECRELALYPHCDAEECGHPLICRFTDWFLYQSKKAADRQLFARRFAQYDTDYRRLFAFMLRTMDYETGRRYIGTHN